MTFHLIQSVVYQYRVENTSYHPVTDVELSETMLSLVSTLMGDHLGIHGAEDILMMRAFIACQISSGSMLSLCDLPCLI